MKTRLEALCTIKLNGRQRRPVNGARDGHQWQIGDLT